MAKRRASWIESFIEQLQTAQPSELAILRRGVSQPTYWVLSRAGNLFRSVPNKGSNEDVTILVAALYAWTKGRCEQTDGVSIGQAYRNYLHGRKADLDQSNRRFIGLLDTEWDDLPNVLRRVILLIKDEALDWQQLTWDLLSWNKIDRPVQRRWARDFWAPIPVKKQENEQALTDDDEVITNN